MLKRLGFYLLQVASNKNFLKCSIAKTTKQKNEYM